MDESSDNNSRTQVVVLDDDTVDVILKFSEREREERADDCVVV